MQVAFLQSSTKSTHVKIKTRIIPKLYNALTTQYS